MTVRGNGVAGGNQEIVLEPKTGTVEMRTLNLQYALTARDVLPWKAFSIESTRVLPLVKEASFKAFSFASAPELMRKN